MRWQRCLFPRHFLRMKIKFSRDPFGELSQTEKVPGLKARFPDRVLIMTTNKCFCRCPHCTRKWILSSSRTISTDVEILAAVRYVKAHREIRDVLLSGGDVFTLTDKEILKLVNTFNKLNQIKIIRLCTRALVVRPKRITDKLVKSLAKCKKLRVSVHINTAREAKIAGRVAAKFIDHGIPVLSQTVLLKGVNDNNKKMLALLQELSAARIVPYYVFQCDPVAGLERFAVPLKKARAIEAYCAERIGGLALPKFVSDIPKAPRKMPISMI